MGLLDLGLSFGLHHDNGVQLQIGEDTPSHTFLEAQAICHTTGLRLCHTQEEMDTSYGTGCHITFACLAR